MSLCASFHNSIAAIGRDNWDRLAGPNYPFTRYEFLSALETAVDHEAAACCAATGWQPQHLALSRDSKEVQAVVPCYLKAHSWGEYVFDWAWADAYQRHNLDYYPKLLAAIPFTPSQGPRILSDPALDHASAIEQVANALINHCQAQQIASAHLLFNTPECSNTLAELDFLQRTTVQYHWFNRNAEGRPLESFEDFLDQLKSRKRKAIKRERRQLADSGLEISRLNGAEVSPELWQQFYRFYQHTYAKRSGHGGYLPAHFFSEIAATMPNKIMLVLASQCGVPVAAALNFYSEDTLYGRYWGCSQEYEFLHFELCYYQGIEFCIEQGLTKFDAGAQGEHKIQRGFIPVSTYSNHWIAEPAFKQAIARFIETETEYNQSAIRALSAQSPYRQPVIS